MVEKGVTAPFPNRLLPGSTGRFAFEDLTISYGPVEGHSIDNTWFLLEREGILAATDQIVPGRLPFYRFLLTQSLIRFERSLTTLPVIPWRLMVAGHGDIGTRADFDYTRAYIRTLRSKVIESAGEIAFPPFVIPGESTYFSFAVNFADAIVQRSIEKMNSTSYASDEVYRDMIRSHADEMFWSIYRSE
jgi:glyoxylase-like metal-dependent hydrolase (beta-lactamase superfamily II)